MIPPACHLFVCTNERPVDGKTSCGAKGAGALCAALQAAIGRRPELWGRAAVTSSGCLGLCFDGPALVAYPAGVFYSGVAAADAEELVEHQVVAGVPLDRLRHAFDDEG